MDDLLKRLNAKASGDIKRPRAKAPSKDRTATRQNNFTTYLGKQEAYIDKPPKQKNKKPDFYEVDGKIVFAPRYGRKPVSHDPNKPTYTVSNYDELRHLIQDLKKATENGLLDTALEKAATKTSAKGKSIATGEAGAGDDSKVTKAVRNAG